MFAFHDLNYIPYGFGDSTAPYIETPAATMRAAATLMCLDLDTDSGGVSTHQEPARTVVCDLGCGDGDFRTDAFLSLPLASDSSCTGTINPERTQLPMVEKNNLNTDCELIKSSACSITSTRLPTTSLSHTASALTTMPS
jgi:hypothetical protein